MAVKLVIVLDAPDDALATAAYGAGADIELQSAADEAFTTPAAVADIPIVADTYQYTYWDLAGTTATWYRWRLTNAGDTETGEWSDPFQGWDPATAARLSGAYATLDALLLRRGMRPPATTQSAELARMEQALVDATERLDEALGQPGGGFFRAPQSGTEVRVFDGTNDRVLHVHEGVISVSAIRIKVGVSADWETVAVGDVRLEYWANRGSPHVLPSGEPYDHVVFTGAGSRTSWPGTPAGVELTGAFQWPRVYPPARKGTIDWALQDLAADKTFAGGVVGPAQLGAPVGPNRMPDSVYRLVSSMSRRHLCAL